MKTNSNYYVIYSGQTKVPSTEMAESIKRAPRHAPLPTDNSTVVEVTCMFFDNKFLTCSFAESAGY